MKHFEILTALGNFANPQVPGKFEWKDLDDRENADVHMTGLRAQIAAWIIKHVPQEVPLLKQELERGEEALKDKLQFHSDIQDVRGRLYLIQKAWEQLKDAAEDHENPDTWNAAFRHMELVTREN